ncbi:nuclear transport factor 2 family protein [Niabella aquatica]
METNILDLEKKYWQAMESRDFETVKSLTRFPCITAGRDGVKNVDADTFKKMFDAGKSRQMKVLDISKEEIQVINDAAIIAYHIQLEFNVDGQPSFFECVCTSTWVNANNDWLCAMHTESDLSR